MNTKIKHTLKTLTLSLTALLIVTTATYAIGTLTPSGTAGDDTQYSLNDIYARLTTNETATEGSGAFETPETVEATFRTLTEIYEAIPTIDPTKVATGTSYLGVEGTLEGATELEWSAQAPTTLNWTNAGLYCSGLEGGWRLPTISELLAAISDDWIINPPGGTLFIQAPYWSGTQFDDTYAYRASWDDDIYGQLDLKTGLYRVRCVR